MGRMIQIDALIAELQDTQERFGNTCVYIRDLSWGAVALNRQAADAERCPKCATPLEAGKLICDCYR